MELKDGKVIGDTNPYEVEDEEETAIETCNELIISLFKKADERKETIKRVIARAATEVHKEV